MTFCHTMEHYVRGHFVRLPGNGHNAPQRNAPNRYFRSPGRDSWINSWLFSVLVVELWLGLLRFGFGLRLVLVLYCPSWPDNNQWRNYVCGALRQDIEWCPHPFPYPFFPSLPSPPNSSTSFPSLSPSLPSLPLEVGPLKSS